MTVDKNIVTDVLDITLKSGAQNARITLNKGVQNSVILLDNKLDQLHHAADLSLYIQLFINERYGAFSTNRIKYDEVKLFIKKGIEATLFLEPDPYRILPEKELYYKGGKEDLHQFDSEIENITTEDRKKITFECSREIFGTNNKLLTAETEFGDMMDYTYMMDSNGFEGEVLQSSYTISTNCSVKGSGNSRPESWWYESSMFLDKLKVKGCAQTALERAIKSINPKKLTSGKYTMVLENTISSRVVAPIISALNGSSIQQNNSFLIDKLGKKMFPENMNLCDEPHLVGYSGSRYFDGEGIATKPIDIISNGIVNTYFLNTYFGKKLGISPTIESPSVLKFSKQEKISEKKLTLASIIKNARKGILVTGFNGGNYNSATGDFSYGIQGFYFDGGDIIHPINEMNVTGNFIQLWNNLLSIGDDPRNCSNWQIPTLAFENVDFSGL